MTPRDNIPDSDLGRPPADGGQGERRLLIDRLRHSPMRVVSVRAPAGSGKTRLLAEWESCEDRVTAWVSLESVADDPVKLLRLIAPVAAAFAPRSADALRDARVADGKDVARVARELASALASADREFALFLDDGGALSARCASLLDIVIAQVPEGSQVIIARREGARPAGSRPRNGVKQSST